MDYAKLLKPFQNKDWSTNVLECTMKTRCFNENWLILEFGVYSGTTINAIAAEFPHRPIVGFDSFLGLPERWRDSFEKGRFNLDGKMPKVKDNVTLIPGWIEETLPEFVKTINEQPIGLLHVDTDTYSAANCILTLLNKSIVPGTVIVFDEMFYYNGFEEHEFKAFCEFVEHYNKRFEVLGTRCDNIQINFNGYEVAEKQQAAIKII